MMICKCGASDVNVSSTVLGIDKDRLTATVSAAITCANCYRLLASGNTVFALNPFYHNFKYPAWAMIALNAARKESE